MENRKNKIKEERANLMYKFCNNYKLYTNYCNSINNAREFVEHYEKSLKRKEDNKDMKRHLYIEILLFIITCISCTGYVFFINPNSVGKFVCLYGSAYSIISVGYIIKQIVVISEETKEIEQKLNEDKIKYKKQKEAIQNLNKLKNHIENTNHNILQQISTKDIELFQLDENNQQEIQSIVEKIYQFPNDKELDTDTFKDTKDKLLIKTKRL